MLSLDIAVYIHLTYKRNIVIYLSIVDTFKYSWYIRELPTSSHLGCIHQTELDSYCSGGVYVFVITIMIMMIVNSGNNELTDMVHILYINKIQKKYVYIYMHVVILHHFETRILGPPRLEPSTPSLNKGSCPPHRGLLQKAVFIDFKPQAFPFRGTSSFFWISRGCCGLWWNFPAEKGRS